VLDEGHQVVNGIFTAAEMRDVIAHLSNTNLDRTKAGARHLLRVPVVRHMADDARLVSLARGFLGASATPLRATLFDKSPKANWLVPWHQDTALPLRREVTAEGWGPWSTKAGVLYAHAPAWALEEVVALRVSLDDSLAENGPLRVLPNTHRSGVLTDAQIERLAREVKPVECVAPSGSVVAMRPLIVHASSKSASDRSRRVLHIEYATAVDLGPGIELAVC
jgi:ectoine hydroxylase-related dioxygenase (phytanoyl-CoA dioxygenase family)